MTSPLSPEAVAQMVADREAGTPGPWHFDGPVWNRIIWTDGENRLCFMAHSNGLNDDRDIANARRITRLPDLEAAYLTLAARVIALEAENATLRAERDAAQSELDDCIASDWPIWAKQIYNTLKEFGYRYDHFDGIDLPEDVSEFLRGFPENAASELMEQRDDALQELATLRASEAAALERVTELEAAACSYQAALLKHGIDGSKGPKE